MISVMNDSTEIKKIKEGYYSFKAKLGDIFSRKKALMKNYRSKLEEAKIKEIKESLNNQSK